MKKSITEKYNLLNLGMSNFDHSIDVELEEALQKGKSYAQYAGLNFCGYVYWGKEEKKYICEVWQHNTWIETIIANTLKEIMEEVSEQYGYE